MLIGTVCKPWLPLACLVALSSSMPHATGQSCVADTFSSNHPADPSCIPCTEVDNAEEGATCTCSTALDSRVSGCATGYTLEPGISFQKSGCITSNQHLNEENPRTKYDSNDRTFSSGFSSVISGRRALHAGSSRDHDRNSCCPSTSSSEQLMLLTNEAHLTEMVVTEMAELDQACPNIDGMPTIAAAMVEVEGAAMAEVEEVAAEAEAAVGTSRDDGLLAILFVLDPDLLFYMFCACWCAVETSMSWFVAHPPRRCLGWLGLVMVVLPAMAEAGVIEHLPSSDDSSSHLVPTLVRRALQVSPPVTSYVMDDETIAVAVAECETEDETSDCPVSQQTYGALSTWDVSAVTNMAGSSYDNAFFGSGRDNVFNADLSAWNTGQVTDMSNMFSYCIDFSSDISAWDVGQVTLMEYTFIGTTKFSSDISTWNVAQVVSMAFMFHTTATFSCDLSAWDIGRVGSVARPLIQGHQMDGMYDMFYHSAMAIDLRAPVGPWDVSNINAGGMYSGSCVEVASKCEAVCASFQSTFPTTPPGYEIADPSGTTVSGLGVKRCSTLGFVPEITCDNNAFSVAGCPPSPPPPACGPGNHTDILATDGATICIPCSGNMYDDDSNSLTACAICQPGATATATTCVACPAGATDHDANSATPCSPCDPGSFAPANQISCAPCLPGTVDADNDPATPCTMCLPGYYAAAEATACVHCPAGYIDHDSNPATPCNSTDVHLCPAGSYAAAGSTDCTDCAQGYADEDSDPSTPCSQCTRGHEQPSTAQTSCTPCGEGRADTDSDSATPCELCNSGYYAPHASISCSACPPGEADTDSSPTTACSVCAPGRYTTAAATTCALCDEGKADTDSDPSTPCVLCEPGYYAPQGSLLCTACASGRADEDLDASTPCGTCINGSFAGLASTICILCEPGRTDGDSNAATQCVACPRGQYSSLTGRIGSCDDCIAGRYAPALANLDADSCEACSPGQYAGNGSTTCDSCAAGTADVDVDPATPCYTCPNGTYAGCGGTRCSRCEPGKMDSDSDPTTPCAECTPGQYWDPRELDIEQVVLSAVCISCEAGKADVDTDSITPCEPCSNGEYADVGSTGCEICSSAGLVDHDEDPSTPCVTVGGACIQFCEQGTEDADCDPSTPCTECAEGQFAEAGYYFEGQTQCRPCDPGSYAAPGSAPADCVACPMGRADNDNNQWTPCQECGPGKFTVNNANELVTTNATYCAECSTGSYDDDENSSTSCSLCPAGKANPVSRSINASACVQCEPGRWSYLEGSSVCPECPVGTYRGSSDLDGCLLCDSSQGELCEVGSLYPRAAPGYFAELTVADSGGNITKLTACVPFPHACLGTCPRSLKKSILEQGSLGNDEGYLAECAPGLEHESCTDGYEGPRCSRCTPFKDDFDDTSCDDNADPPIVNGYYRLESRCIPCPCTWIKFHHMVIGLFLLVIVFLFALDLVDSEFAEHASTLAAPTLILISFCQTVAAYVDTGIPWPALLRQVMTIFSALSLNLELTRPDCAGEFGALQKAQLALFSPLFIGAAIALYSIIAVVKIQTLSMAETSKRSSSADSSGGEANLSMSNSETVAAQDRLGAEPEPTVGTIAEQRHSARHLLKRKIASVGTTLFTVGAIFFVKSFVRAFDCVASESDSSRSFMSSAPDIECNNLAEHAAIVRLSTIGLVGFCGCFTVIWLLLIKAHRSDNPGLGIFAFLADKFEDHFYYWEMLIVLRKVLLMSTFLLFSRVPAVLLATLLTIFALSIHIAARPFEHRGTDWIEMLALFAQLITLVSGLVFIILSDPDSGMDPARAASFRDFMELAGVFVVLMSLGTSLWVQIDLRRAVTSNGDDHEHDDFKIRTEQRRQQEMEIALEQQKAVVEKLIEAREVLLKERMDVKALRDHQWDDDQAYHESSGSGEVDTSVNPLHQ